MLWGEDLLYISNFKASVWLHTSPKWVKRIIALAPLSLNFFDSSSSPSIYEKNVILSHESLFPHVLGNFLSFFILKDNPMTPILIMSPLSSLISYKCEVSWFFPKAPSLLFVVLSIILLINVLWFELLILCSIQDLE